MLLALGVFYGQYAVADQPMPGRVIPSSQTQVTLSFAPVAARTTPAVVNVYARRIERQATFWPFGDDPLFRRFFRNDDFFGRPRERVKQSLGSGVIIDAGGYIVTNYHVIENARDIRIVLADKREFAAEIVATDPRMDLAVLQVETMGQPLPSLPLGNSDSLRVGDLVLAIGNPFGVGQTVTGGLVSALARTHVGVSSYQFFIQTDAAINPGNSGGALVNMAGELVGINTAIFSRSGGSNGIGFAIPVNMLRPVIYAARNDAPVLRPWSGVELQRVDASIAPLVGLADPRGVLISAIHPLSPLAEAGLSRGDVITAIADHDIREPDEFSYRFAGIPLGETVSVTFIHKKTARSVRVKSRPAPEEPPRRQTIVRGLSSPLEGLEVVNLSPAASVELGIDNFRDGVAIVAIHQGVARNLRVFRPKDILLTVNGQTVASVQDLIRILKMNQQQENWLLQLERDGRRLSIPLER